LILILNPNNNGINRINSKSNKTNKAAKKKKGELIKRECQTFSNPDSIEES
jgi:hypothetical protein